MRWLVGDNSGILNIKVHTVQNRNRGRKQVRLVTGINKDLNGASSAALRCARIKTNELWIITVWPESPEYTMQFHWLIL